MNSLETPPSVIDQEKSTIQKLTSRNVGDIVLNDVGGTSRAYILNNGEIVFKFPRTEQVKGEYTPEIAAYKLVNSLRTTVSVPKIQWEGADNNYFGYEGIVGQSLDKVDEFPGETKIKIGTAVGEFLAQFHKQQLESAREMTVEDEIEEFQRKYQLSMEVIKERFNETEQARLKQLATQEIPDTMRTLGSDRALCHGDLGYWNIILGDGGEIGIIDFGDVGYYDSSKDFIGLTDQEVMDASLKVYGDTPTLRENIAIRKKLLYILDLWFFISKANRAAIDKSISDLRALLG